MTSAVSILTGVQWTELNGANLSVTQETELATDIRTVSDALAALTTAFTNLPKNNTEYETWSMDAFRAADGLPNNALLSAIHRLTGINLYTDSSGATTKMTRSELLSMLNVVKEASFKEASKLTINNGGGIKTYGGRWFVNGQEVDYLSVTFAVRVNQLYVINNSITGSLNQIQRNNQQIRTASGLADVINALTPANSSSTVEINKLNNKIINYALASGLSVPVWGPTTATELTAVLTTDPNYNKPDKAAFIGTVIVVNGVYKYVLHDNATGKNYLQTGTNPNGTMLWREFSATTSVANFASIAFTADGLASIGLTNIPSTIAAMGKADNIAWSGIAMHSGPLKELLGASYSKLFNSYNYPLTTGTLSQTDMNTIVTELKSFSSTMDSSNQMQQTQLTQYNDKRSEVMESLSSIVKGNTTLLQSLGRNMASI